MIDIITITGDRLEAFTRCRHYIERQNINESLRWIIVDDGVEQLKPEFYPEWAVYRRLEPNKNKKISFLTNLKEAIGLSISDKIVFMEDDDWYSPNYIRKIAQLLDHYKVVGEGEAYYYNIKELVYRRNPNVHHSSLCSTALHASILSLIWRVAHKDSTFIDTIFWEKCKQQRVRRTVYLDERNCVGIKGMPGRKGIGSGHRATQRRGYTLDENYSMLKKLISIQDDVEYYINVHEKYFSNSVSK